MRNDANERDDLIPTEDEVRGDRIGAAPAADAVDVNAEVPVPPAMSPAEIDERAKVIDTLRGDRPAEP